MIWLLAFIGIFVAALIGADKLLAAPKYAGGTSDHFDGKRFVNPHDNLTHSYWDVLKWWLGGNDKGTWHKLDHSDVTQFSAPLQEVNARNFHITFVNHATFLLQVDGLNILTDPVWSDRASPYQWIGPKRMRPPGIAFEDLPPIDAVLISHNHYDHLDIRTVKRLQQKHDPEFIVPLGVDKLLNDEGINKTVQLDWWDETSLESGLELTAVPAQHFSGRGLFDRNKTLWCGFVLHSSLGNIYFAGDTGYGSFLKDIGRKFGPMHTSFIPIGAYIPNWFMKSIHVSPKEAIKAHQDVCSEYSIGMHFGTFPMADDGMYQPIEDLEIAKGNYRLGDKEFLVLEPGKPHKSRGIKTSVESDVA